MHPGIFQTASVVGEARGLMLALLLGATGLLAFAPSSARAEIRELDAIVAVVDDDVVLASEMLDRLSEIRKQIQANNVPMPPNDVLMSQLLERLVLESLQLQQAERRGIEIDDETLTRAVAGFAERNNMSLEAFRQALVADGMSYRAFREQIRREMIISRLQRGMVNRRIQITDQEIDAILDSPFYQQLLSDEFRVGHILLAIAEDATEEAIALAEAKAAELIDELRRGANFQELAIANSAGGRALEGGDLGWRRAGELPSLFASQVMQLDVGETADPIRSPSGIHIVQLLEQRGAGVQTEMQTHARHILVQPSEIRSEAETEALIRDLRRQIDNGADFAELAKVHSEDPGSALNGGDLGWSNGEAFVENFRNVLLATQPGEVSAPFRSRYGWHIIEVLDRREQDMSEEARRNMVVQLLHTRRFQEELEEWLKEIRDEAFVEIRI